MLPSYVPKARILRYGYDSRWYGDAAVSTRLSAVSEELLGGLIRKRRVCLDSIGVLPVSARY